MSVDEHSLIVRFKKKTENEMEIAMLNAKIIFLILVKKFYIPFECLSLIGHKEPPFFYFIFFYQRVYLVPLAKGTSLYKEI